MSDDFFAVEDLPADRTAWATLTDLADDPSARIAESATALHTGDPRVAASIDLLSVAARVLSPALQLTLEESAVPWLSKIWWRHDRPAMMRIAWQIEGFAPSSPEAFVSAVVDRTLGPIVDGYCRAARLSRRVAWGDVASALNGAAASIGTVQASGFVRIALAVGGLAGTARRLPPRFVRNSCCLYYRAPAGGLCGDCVLRRPR